jgi:hypothetical protein
MELRDPNVFGAFINYVMSLQSPERLILKKELLIPLVQLLNHTHKVLDNGEITPFSVSARDAPSSSG